MNDTEPGSTPRRKKNFFLNVGSLISARGFLAISQLLVLPIMARQLSIGEFAIMAMAMSLIVFSSVLSDAGLGRSLIRTEKFDRTEWSTVFWLMIAVGGLLCVLIIFASPVWAWFFDEPRLIWIVSALSFIPLLQAMTAAHSAFLEREENYTGIARVQVITTVISLGIAVALAFLGAGVWALVGQQIALAGSRLIGIFVLSDFRPTLIFDRSKIGPHLVFARDSVFVSIIAAVQTQSGVVAIGKFLGTDALGLFSMSERFARLPQFGFAGPFSTVVYVRMAQVQRDLSKIRDVYLASLRLTTFFLVPVMLMAAACSESLFSVLLSDSWVSVAPIFTWSIIGLTIEAAAGPTLGAVFRAIGRTEYNVRLSTERMFLRVLLVVLAAQFSVVAVAIAISISGAVMVYRGWHLARQLTPISPMDCLKVMSVPMLCAIIAWATHFAVRQVFEFDRFTDILAAMTLAGFALGVSFLIDRVQITQSIKSFRK